MHIKQTDIINTEEGMLTPRFHLSGISWEVIDELKKGRWQEAWEPGVDSQRTHGSNDVSLPVVGQRGEHSHATHAWRTFVHISCYDGEMSTASHWNELQESLTHGIKSSILEYLSDFLKKNGRKGQNGSEHNSRGWGTSQSLVEGNSPHHVALWPLSLCCLWVLAIVSKPATFLTWKMRTLSQIICFKLVTIHLEKTNWSSAGYFREILKPYSGY